MRLNTYCTSCKTDFKIKSQATTRPELQMEHINDVRAEIDNNILIGAVVIGVIATIILWVYFGAIATVSIGIPLLVWNYQMGSVKTFNSFMIKRK